jgi:glutaconyl-CoA decarboxylase
MRNSSKKAFPSSPASYARRLVKDKDSGKPLDATIQKMNEIVKHYEEFSRPYFCEKKGFVDEVVRFEDMRKYLVAFANCVWQYPASICPQHHMILPRVIQSRVVTGLKRPPVEQEKKVAAK